MEPYEALVIGGSAGSVLALRTILAGLSTPPWPLFVVLHVPQDSRLAFSTAFVGAGPCPVVEAEDKMRPEPGTLHVAPPGYHMLIENNGSIALSTDPPVHLSIPSIDVLFESAAAYYGSKLIAVLLSGASDDGALGIQAVDRAGGVTVVQNPNTAEFETMPASALSLTPTLRVLDLDAIAAFLNALHDPQAASSAPSSDVGPC